MSRTRLPSVPFALRALPIAAGFALLAAAAPRAQAQDVARDPQAVTLDASRQAAPPAVTPAPVAPSMSVTPAAVTRSAVGSEADPASAFRVAQARETGVAVAQSGNQKQGKVYMIVGGAALITGAIVGDDAGGIIMIGGALIGLWGLYQYLK